MIFCLETMQFQINQTHRAKLPMQPLLASISLPPEVMVDAVADPSLKDSPTPRRCD
jgi:hypothetical protein